MKLCLLANDVGCIASFIDVVHMLAGLRATGVLRLNQERLLIIIREESVAEGGLDAFAELAWDKLFKIKFTGLAPPEHDEILLEVPLDKIEKCLVTKEDSSTSLLLADSTATSLGLIKQLTIRLTNHHGQNTPALEFKIEQCTVPGVHNTIVRRILPVSLLPLSVWDGYTAELGDEASSFDLSICLPPVKTVQAIISSLKAIDNILTIAVNAQGELLFMLTRSYEFEVKITFKDVKIRKADSIRDEPNRLVSANVDMRMLDQILACQKHDQLLQFVCNIRDETIAEFICVYENYSVRYRVHSHNFN